MNSRVAVEIMGWKLIPRGIDAVRDFISCKAQAHTQRQRGEGYDEAGGQQGWVEKGLRQEIAVLKGDVADLRKEWRAEHAMLMDAILALRRT